MSINPHSSKLVQLYRNALAQGLSVAEIDAVIDRWQSRQKVTQQVESDRDEHHTLSLKRQIPAFVRYGALAVPLIFIALGMFLVGNAVVPLTNYVIDSTVPLVEAKIISPIPDEVVFETASEVAATSNQDKVFTNVGGPTILNEELDYTNLANWFSVEALSDLRGSAAATSYRLEIPSLDITEAEVVLGGTELDDHLIQYPGTAEPGDLGAPVIFGHSVLRQFYNPSLKNPRRYVSIFSKIMTMKKGDEIIVIKDDVRYTYVVESKTEVQPEDVYILTQEYDAKRLKLVTCTPEGTYLRRGVVTAVLKSDAK